MFKEMIMGAAFVVATLTQTKIVPPDVATPVVPPKVSESGSEQGDGQDYAAPTDCQLLRDLPGYTFFTPEGAEVYVPDGEALWEEINEDGHKGMEREKICATLVAEYDSHLNE